MKVSHGQKVPNDQIAQVLQINTKTVERLKQRFLVKTALRPVWIVSHIQRKETSRQTGTLKLIWLH